MWTYRHCVLFSVVFDAGCFAEHQFALRSTITIRLLVGTLLPLTHTLSTQSSRVLAGRQRLGTTTTTQRPDVSISLSPSPVLSRCFVFLSVSAKDPPKTNCSGGDWWTTCAPNTVLTFHSISGTRGPVYLTTTASGILRSFWGMFVVVEMIFIVFMVVLVFTRYYTWMRND